MEHLLAIFTAFTLHSADLDEVSDPVSWAQKTDVGIMEGARTYARAIYTSKAMQCAMLANIAGAGEVRKISGDCPTESLMRASD